jgi:hypothetical protein
MKLYLKIVMALAVGLLLAAVALAIINSRLDAVRTDASRPIMGGGKFAPTQD